MLKKALDNLKNSDYLFFLRYKNFSKLTILIIIASALTLLFTLILAYLVYKNIELEQKQLYIDSALHIEEILNNTFDDTHKNLHHLAKKILKDEEISLETIAKILKVEKSKDNIDKTLYSWTFIDWINKENKLVVNAAHGKYDKPLDMSSRKYLSYTSKQPWKLYFSDPIVGVASGELVLPIAMGITNKEGFCGTLSLSLLIEPIKIKLNNYFTNSAFKYFVLDQFGNSIFYSENNKSLNYQKLIQSLQYSDSITKQFTDNSFIGETEFLHKVKKYPFFIVIQSSIISSKFKSIMYPVISIFTTIVCIFIGLLIYYNNYILNIISSNTNLIIENLSNTDIRSSVSKSNIFQLDKLTEYIGKILNNNSDIQQEIIEYKFKYDQFINSKRLSFYNFAYQMGLILKSSKESAKEAMEKWKDLKDQEQYAIINLLTNDNLKALNLIQGLLEVLEQNPLKLNIKKQVDLIEIIKTAINNAKTHSQNENKKIKYLINIEPNIKTNISFDVEKILVVLNHLLSNAVIHSYNEDTIEININQNIEDKNSMIISIKDYGEGIPSGEESFIFHPLFKTSKMKSWVLKGQGLGLSLCKRIIESHRGAIWAKNNEHNTGATISFTLPFIESQEAKITNKKCIIQTKNGEILLSERETDCARLLVQGKTIKEIANQLDITSRTVEVHLTNIKLKTGIQYKSELISFLRNHTNLELL